MKNYMKNFLRFAAVAAVVLIVPLFFVGCQVAPSGQIEVTYVNTNDLKVGINLSIRSSLAVGANGSAGSGVIYKIEGDAMWVITNWHVISNSSGTPAGGYRVAPAGVSLSDNSAFTSVTLLGGSKYYDIAILKAAVSQDLIGQFSLRAADISQYDSVQYGDAVFAVGNSVARGISATSGRVSVPSEYVDGEAIGSTGTVSRRVIRTDAAIQQGNSGGGLFESSGKLIGIVQSKTMYYDNGNSKNPADNMAYAIPVSIACRIAAQIVARNAGTGASLNDADKDNLIEKFLGVELMSANLKTSVDSDGSLIFTEDVTVKTVLTGHNIGLAQNDIIVKIECGGKSQVVKRLYQVREFLIECWNETNVTVTLTGGGTHSGTLLAS
jgi:S1-C subfamily serine protease